MSKRSDTVCLSSSHIFRFYLQECFKFACDTVRCKVSRPKNFANRFQKGDRNIRDKNICEGGSDTLRNTITWLLCLCGSSDL